MGTTKWAFVDRNAICKSYTEVSVNHGRTGEINVLPGAQSNLFTMMQVANEKKLSSRNHTEYKNVVPRAGKMNRTKSPPTPNLKTRAYSHIIAFSDHFLCGV